MKIPKNAHQRRIVETEKARFSPDTSFLLRTACTIKAVYDTEESNYVTLPEDIVARLKESPGVLLAEVELPQKRLLVLRFKETADQIYSTYGTSALLEGARAIIEHRVGGLESGLVIPSVDRKRPNLDNSQVSKVYSIGAILGL